MWALAVVLAAGTLATLARFQRGRPLAGAYLTVACWASLALGTSGWLLPAAEPYRLSRVVGEKLAHYVATEHARPILLTYQEPGIHYAMKLISPTLRDWDDVRRSLDTAGTLVSPVTRDQYDGLCLDGRFRIDVLEDLGGFNVSKLKSQRLRLIRIQLSPAALALRAIEQAKVK
jgi:hypothetical protein